MGRKLTAQASSGADIPDGTYEVEVTKIEDVEIDSTAFGKGIQPGLKFTFAVGDITDEEGKAVELVASATAERLTPKTKLWGWIEALTGESLSEGNEVDIDILLGCHALASVENEPSKKDGTIWAHIKGLMALPKTAVRGTEKRDQYEGFRKTDGSVDWGSFSEYMKAHDCTPGILASFMGVEKASPAAIRGWLDGRHAATLTMLVEDATRPAEPEDLPFE